MSFPYNVFFKYTIFEIIDRIANQTVQLCHSTVLEFRRLFTQNVLRSDLVWVLLKGNLLSYQKTSMKYGQNIFVVVYNSTSLSLFIEMLLISLQELVV